MKHRRSKEAHRRIATNSGLRIGAVLAGALMVRSNLDMQQAKVKPASLTLDGAGHWRTSRVDELTANTLTYMFEQADRSMLVVGSVAAIGLITAFAASRYSHKRSRAVEKNAVETKRATQRAARQAAQDTAALSIKNLGARTDALIAMSRAIPAATIRDEFTRRAMEMEATRPKDFFNLSALELVRLAQTNQAIPIKEEAYYSDTETTQRTPMSRTLFRSIAAFKEFHDDTIPQDSGYHPPVDVQRGVYDLMPQLAATPSVGDPHPTAPYPQVTPQPA